MDAPKASEARGEGKETGIIYMTTAVENRLRKRDWVVRDIEISVARRRDSCI